MTIKYLYLVTEGHAVQVGPEAQYDGERSILVYATDDADALRLATRYDNGEIQPDNMEYQGRTISVLRD